MSDSKGVTNRKTDRVDLCWLFPMFVVVFALAMLGRGCPEPVPAFAYAVLAVRG